VSDRLPGADRLPLFNLTNTIRRDVVEGIAKAYELGYAEGFAKGFAEGGIAEQVRLGTGPIGGEKAGLEAVAQWMIARSYATGHGDTIEDMLVELEWQAASRTRPVVRSLALVQRQFTLDDLRKADEMDRRHKEEGSE
jgi:hypothetical protein